ncbi:MAG: DNA repair protein RecO [Acidobacteriota bacterium]|jgi:DNA repair protein RecO (recombination protein O)|nr:DNA repair protein RecO [Acidobacteriota bacterium]
MPSLEAEAIVLRHHPLAEADRIVVLLTREQGKLRAAAGGAKKTKSQLAGTVEPFNHLRVSLWFREGKDLGQVHGAELIQAYPGKGLDLGSVYACSYFAEIVNEIAPDGQPNPVLFRLLLASLKACALRPPTPALVRYFEIWALRACGFVPDLGRCAACGRPVAGEGFRFAVASGGALCRDCGGKAGAGGVPLGVKSAEALEKMMKLPPEEFMILPFGQTTAAEIEQFARRLLVFHLERRLKSYPLLREALQGGV